MTAGGGGGSAAFALYVQWNLRRAFTPARGSCSTAARV